MAGTVSYEKPGGLCKDKNQKRGQAMTLSRNSKKLAIVIVFAALGLSLLIPVRVWAQVAGATLSGTITDASGSSIPQVSVSIKNVATGITTSSVANSSGFYTATNLLPGSYEIRVSVPGFTTMVRSGVNLTVGAQQVLDFTLQVGRVDQTVEVTGEAPAIETTSSSISGLVNSNTVVELPLNGRDWTQLATLQPGVNALQNQVPSGLANPGAHRGTRGNGAQVTISGTRPQLNNYRLDGISVVDHTGGSPGGTNGIALGVDAIEEFSVLTANYSAEYGRTAGGVINAITRSGTNQFHGDAYWFLRDEGLDARGFFDQSIPPFHRNQFGASAGGPIQKDKTFFFADYEGFRQNLGLTTVNNVPSADARNGIIHNSAGTACTIGVITPGCAFTNSAGTVGVDPLVQPFLPFYPLPNAGLIGNGDTGLYLASVTNIAVENFVTARMDRKFSEADSVHGIYLYDKGNNHSPDIFNTVDIANFSSRQTVVLEETHVFNPRLVNSLRFGFNRVLAQDTLGTRAINPLAADLSLGSFPGKPAPQINVSGLASFTGGLGATGGVPRIWNSYQVYDDAFMTRGAHSLKFGFAFERMQLNINVIPGQPNGRFSFASLTNFLINQPRTFGGGPPTTAYGLQMRQSLFGGYLQDDWRVRSNLTLNLGVRYEAVTVPYDKGDHLSNLHSFTDAAPTLHSKFFNNPTLRNFEPRVGFAWDPFRDGKTSVRGAFGIFDALPLNNSVQEMENAAPFSFTIASSQLAQGAFPVGAASVSTADPSSLQFVSVEFNPHRNYLMIWNLNVQRQLTPSTTLMVGYVGNHGVHNADRADDVDMVLPATTPAGLLWPSPAGSGTKLNPNFGSIRAAYWAGSSRYDALQVQVTKAMSHGFQVQGSYTWAKNLDTGSSNVSSDEYSNSISSPLWFCAACRRGLADYDVAHNLTVNYLWNLPSPKNWGFLGSSVLGGWELGGLISAHSGIPFTPRIAGDPLGQNSSDPFAYPDRARGCGSLVNPQNASNYVNLSCFTPPNPLTLFGNTGRNSVIGPGLVNVDFAVIKNTRISRISEAFNAQFRVEFFNIFNRANFAPPLNNSTLFDEDGSPIGGAGSLDQLATRPREIQLALKLIW
jgi:outer membrane receptor protein involved in Fe transport